MTDERRSWHRRLHSLSGILPIGGFLAFHLYQNSAATRGADEYNRTAAALQRLPAALALEVLVIIVPILYHGIYGLFLIADPRPDVMPSSRLRNFTDWLQRATGVIVFAFVLFHLWTTRLVQIEDHESLDLFHQVQAAIANPWIRAFYVAGILSATGHLAIGIWSFSRVWGLAVSPKAQRRMILVAAVLFVVLSYIGVRSIQAFRL